MPTATTSPAERTLQARAAAHSKWKNTEDRTAATEPARLAFLERLADEVDPERRLDPETRARMVESARAEHMQRMALASVRARRARREARRQAAP